MWLTYKHEVLSSILRTNLKIGMVMCTWDRGTGEGGERQMRSHWGPLASQSSLLGRFQGSESPGLKKRKKWLKPEE